jgi:ATP-dependent DNA helicase RecQ
MLAQFIIGWESVAPGCQQVVSNIIEALYEFRSGSQAGESDSRHAPLLLLTAHRAKGLEFDHVLIVDGGGWQQSSDEERRLFYVAMTRARKTLTLCARQSSTPHPFIRDCQELCLKTQPKPTGELQLLAQRIWFADPGQVVLSWPGYFSPDKPIHNAIAELDVGSELILRVRSDGKLGWEIANKNGIAVARMAQAFTPPTGEIVSVRVSAIQVRIKKPGDQENLKCHCWEIVLPEIVFNDH